LRRYWRILALGIGAYLLVLLLAFPAERATGYLEQQFTGLSLQAVRGTVFSGRAAGLVIQGVQTGSVRWTLRPAALLLGRLEYHVTLDGDSLRGTGNVGSGLGASVVVHDVTAEINPEFLMERFSPVPLQATGSVTLAIDTLRIRDSFPDELYGRMSWNNAGLQDPTVISLGQVEMVLGSTGDSVTGTLSNTPGDVALSGDISLQSSGEYNLRLELAPQTSASSELVQMLDAYGQRQPNGTYLLKEAGRW
jgi:general secretion pathway protein N